MKDNNGFIWLLIMGVLLLGASVFLALQPKPKDRYFLIKEYKKEVVYVDTTKKYYYENVDSSAFMYRWISTWADTVEVFDNRK